MLGYAAQNMSASNSVVVSTLDTDSAFRARNGTDHLRLVAEPRRWRSATPPHWRPPRCADPALCMPSDHRARSNRREGSARLSQPRLLLPLEDRTGSVWPGFRSGDSRARPYCSIPYRCLRAACANGKRVSRRSAPGCGYFDDWFFYVRPDRGPRLSARPPLVVSVATTTMPIATTMPMVPATKRLPGDPLAAK